MMITDGAAVSETMSISTLADVPEAPPRPRAVIEEVRIGDYCYYHYYYHYYSSLVQPYKQIQLPYCNGWIIQLFHYPFFLDQKIQQRTVLSPEACMVEVPW